MPSSFNPTRRRLMVGASVITIQGLPGIAKAQAWPSRALRIVVPFAPGGASDGIARILVEQLPKRLGQSAYIDNKPGGSTIIGVDTVAKAPADGYTLLIAGAGSFSVLPALRKNLPFDINRDLASIALLNYTPNVLVTGSQTPYRTLTDLIKAAKAKPGSVRYATYGDGSANHLCGVLLANTTGVEMEPIPYKGATDAKLALLRGDVDLSFETLASAGGDLKGGRLRALAHGGAGRTALLPNLPGLSEYGWGAASFQPFFGLAVAAATPVAIRNRLTKEVLEIMALPEVRERALANYLEPVTIGPDQMNEIVRTSTATFRQIGQQLKLSLD